jgi:histidine triad (HIT) family protein
MPTAASDCLFCKLAAGTIPVTFLHTSKSAFAIADINPQAPSHFLVIPTSHYANAALLAEGEPAALAELFQIADSLATDQGLTGYRAVFNTGESVGQSVFHAHLHVLGGRSFAWPPG